jgi:hypothetical protein
MLIIQRYKKEIYRIAIDNFKAEKTQNIKMCVCLKLFGGETGRMSNFWISF